MALPILLLLFTAAWCFLPFAALYWLAWKYPEPRAEEFSRTDLEIDEWLSVLSRSQAEPGHPDQSVDFTSNSRTTNIVYIHWPTKPSTGKD